MEKSKISRSYQENLLANLADQAQDMMSEIDQVAAAKKILVSMRYFMTNFSIDDDIIDDMSSIVDKVMERLDMNVAISAHMQNNVTADA
jgi:hypothetical protein